MDAALQVLQPVHLSQSFPGEPRVMESLHWDVGLHYYGTRDTSQGIWVLQRSSWHFWQDECCHNPCPTCLAHWCWPIARDMLPMAYSLLHTHVGLLPISGCLLILLPQNKAFQGEEQPWNSEPSIPEKEKELPSVVAFLSLLATRGTKTIILH